MKPIYKIYVSVSRELQLSNVSVYTSEEEKKTTVVKWDLWNFQMWTRDACKVPMKLLLMQLFDQEHIIFHSCHVHTNEIELIMATHNYNLIK